jgi:hypothetical protein
MSDQLVAQAATYTTRLHKRQTSMPPAVFEPTIPAIQRPQIHNLGRNAAGIGHHRISVTKSRAVIRDYERNTRMGELSAQLCRKLGQRTLLRHTHIREYSVKTDRAEKCRECPGYSVHWLTLLAAVIHCGLCKGKFRLANNHVPSQGAFIYRVSQEECAKLRKSVHYVKVYRYNPKHLYSKLNGY